MFYFVELLYLFSIFIIVAAFTLHMTVKAKNLTAVSVLAKQKTTTWVLGSVMLYNLCDFVIVYFRILELNQNTMWIYAVENLLEIIIAYAVIAMVIECIGNIVPRWIDVLFVVVGMLIFYFEVIFTDENGQKEIMYTAVMLMLNTAIIIVLLCYYLKFARLCLKKERWHENNWYILLYELCCILICVLSTVYAIGESADNALAFSPVSDFLYVTVWLFFNCYCFVFVWKTLSVDDRTETARLQTPEERLAFVTETYGLSEREQEIARLIFEGKNNKDIAAQLYLSPNTIKVHASNLYRKLGAANRVQAVQVLRGETINKDSEE